MSLDARIKKLIGDAGPIPVSVFMEMCLHDPSFGYYATRSGLGRDFTTAPEISQLFGECVGVWVALAWQDMGRPSAVQLVECGPGRGILMADVLRTLTQIAPDFVQAADVVLVEASPDLRGIQKEKLSAVKHLDSIAGIQDIPTILFANEFLDCLPVRKYAKSEDRWAEIRVGLDDDGALCFVPICVPNAGFPEGVEALEIQPALDGLITSLASRATPLRSLWIDYGSSDGRVQDSFRAYALGELVDPLINPGACDLTADVDFHHLQNIAQAAGLRAHLRTQAAFLLGHGLEARFEALTRNMPMDQKQETYAATRRLTHPDELGVRFKCLELRNGY